jgi:hypothetical protein
MRETWITSLVVLILAGPAYAQRLPLPEPVLEVGGPTVVEVGKKCVLKAQTTAKRVTWRVPAGCDTEALDGRRLAVWALPGTYTFVAMVPSGDDVVSIDYVLTVVGPRPPPGPGPGPGPEPPPVVSSFRVIWVKESGTKLPTAQQNAVIGAKTVQEYLYAKTTQEGGVTGWREYDPQTNASNDHPGMRTLWAATQSKITTVPCVIIQVNDKAEIFPFPANAADALTLLQSKGGK